jgi:hypothetical protein
MTLDGGKHVGRNSDDYSVLSPSPDHVCYAVSQGVATLVRCRAGFDNLRCPRITTFLDYMAKFPDEFSQTLFVDFHGV